MSREVKVGPKKLLCMSHLGLRSLLLSASVLTGCGSDVEPILDPTLEGEITDTRCNYNSECNDGVFCNGEETCDAGFCRTGVAIRCDDKIDCTHDTCSHATNSCQFTAPDEDGDNHADASCLGNDKLPLGDDCDDQDPTRFPGNLETCSDDEPDHDEDCDPLSFGLLDNDLDGETSSACCNKDENGKEHCGSDCDDDDYRVSSDYPEICDDLDNDCDGKVDKNTKEVPWYPDSDGDHFGDGKGESVLSCAPVEGHSLKPTDCDDSTGAVNRAAREICDGVDNDCDGDTDENGVCACAPEGNVRPCACGSTASGVQSCSGGVWGTCDCSECITGTDDCVGELLPRTCQEGRWITLRACSGLHPLCLDGACRCADGTDDCDDLLDVFVPQVLTTSPLDGNLVSPELIIAAEMSEEVSLLSAKSAILLQNAFGQQITGKVGVSGTTVSFVPDSPLAPGMFYKFIMKNTLEDLSGNKMIATETFGFQTESGVPFVRVSDNPETLYKRPQLFTSSGGANLLFAGRLADNRMSSLIWNGTKWERVEEILDFQPMMNAAIDDAGRAVNLFLDGTATKRQLIQSGARTLEESVSGTRSDIYGALATGNGYAMTIYEAEAEVKFQTGTTSGDWSETKTIPQSEVSITSWAFAGGRNGHAAFIYQNANGSHSYRSSENFLTWISGNAGGPTPAAKTLAVAVSDAGVASVAWVEEVDTGSGFRSQIFVQDLSTTGNWLGSPTTPSGNLNARNENSPQLAYDGAGNLFLVFSFDKTLVVNRRNHAGIWATERVASTPDSPYFAQVELRASTAQGAAVTWIQTTQKANLWGIRYDGIDGWGPSRLLEDQPADINFFSSGFQGDGSNLVVFNSTHDGSQSDLFSLEF